jgi:hypothetical protein
MRSRYLIIGLSLGLLLVLVPRPAAAAAESITNLAVSAHLSKSNVLDVTESIDYDFGDAKPHTISHSLPLSYYDDQGNAYPITFTWLDAHLNSGAIDLKPTVGSTSAQFTLPPGSGPGLRHYQLHYKLAPVVLNGAADDILRWRVTGLDWPAPITAASLRLQTPGLTTTSPTCLTGDQSNTSSNCVITQDGSTTTVTTDAAMAPGTGLTLYCDFPHNAFTAYLKATNPASSWVLPITALVVILAGIIVAPIVLIRRFRRPAPPPES